MFTKEQLANMSPDERYEIAHAAQVTISSNLSPDGLYTPDEVKAIDSAYLVLIRIAGVEGIEDRMRQPTDADSERRIE